MPCTLTRSSKSLHISLHIESTLSNMPHITCAKWDRTLILNIPIFITIWIGLCAALEIHLRLIIRHNIEGYQLNTYQLEVSGYSDNPWWRELYINLEFSRLHFGNCPISPLNNDEAPSHADHGDHAPEPEGRPPTPPWQSDPLGSNQTVLVSTRGNIPQPAEPPRYYNSQYLNLMGENPMLAAGPAPNECPPNEELSWNMEYPSSPDDEDDLPPLPTCPMPRQLKPIEPRNLSGQLVPPPEHCIIMPPPWPTNLVERTYMDWQEYFAEFHNRIEPNWGDNPLPQLIVEESSNGTSQLFWTPPQSEIKVELSGNEVDIEEAEAEPGRAQPDEAQPAGDLGQSIDAWPSLDQALDEIFAPPAED